MDDYRFWDELGDYLPEDSEGVHLPNMDDYGLEQFYSDERALSTNEKMRALFLALIMATSLTAVYVGLSGNAEAINPGMIDIAEELTDQGQNFDASSYLEGR